MVFICRRDNFQVLLSHSNNDVKHLDYRICILPIRGQLFYLYTLAPPVQWLTSESLHRVNMAWVKTWTNTQHENKTSDLWQTGAPLLFVSKHTGVYGYRSMGIASLIDTVFLIFSLFILTHTPALVNCFVHVCDLLKILTHILQNGVKHVSLEMAHITLKQSGHIGPDADLVTKCRELLAQTVFGSILLRHQSIWPT